MTRAWEALHQIIWSLHHSGKLACIKVCEEACIKKWCEAFDRNDGSHKSFWSLYQIWVLHTLCAWLQICGKQKKKLLIFMMLSFWSWWCSSWPWGGRLLRSSSSISSHVSLRWRARLKSSHKESSGCSSSIGSGSGGGGSSSNGECFS